MIMKPKDLRIGNLVYQDYIKDNVIVTGFFNSSDEVWYDYKDAELRGPIQSFQPIPLTEEWLIGFGFKEIVHFEDGKGFLIEDEMRANYNDKMGFWEIHLIVVTGEERYCVPGIKYVHSLQNLFYCLYNEELILKS